MFGIQSSCLFSGDLFHAWDEDSGFQTVVVRYCEYRVVPLRYWEFSYEVNGYSLERRSFRFSPDGLERCFSGAVVDLMPLTFGASLHVIRYFSA
jgi:hypothetical protein